MKIKYLLILMFFLCFVSNAFGQFKTKLRIQNVDNISKDDTISKSYDIIEGSNPNGSWPENVVNNVFANGYTPPFSSYIVLGEDGPGWSHWGGCYFLFTGLPSNDITDYTSMKLNYHLYTTDAYKWWLGEGDNNENLLKFELYDDSGVYYVGYTDPMDDQTEYTLEIDVKNDCPLALRSNKSIRIDNNSEDEVAIDYVKLEYTYNPPIPSDLRLSQSTVPSTVPWTGGNYSVRVNNDGDETLYWNTQYVPSWVGLYPSSNTSTGVSGGSSQNVNITVNQNNDTNSRDRNIRFYNTQNTSDDDYLYIYQEGKPPEPHGHIHCIDNNIPDVIPAIGDTYWIEIENNGDAPIPWESDYPSWITLNPSSGSLVEGEHCTIDVYVEENTSSDSRNGTIAIEADYGGCEISVEQEGQPDYIPVGNLKITGDVTTGSDPQYTITNNVKIGYIEQSENDFLIIFPNATANVNTSTNTITISNGFDNFHSFYNEDLKFINLNNIQFNCNQGTANIPTAMFQIDPNDYIEFSDATINFELRKLEDYDLNLRVDYIGDIPLFNCIINLENSVFSTGLQMGECIDLGPIAIDTHSEVTFFYDISNKAVGTRFDLNFLEIGKSCENGGCIDRNSFIFSPLPEGPQIHVSWDIDDKILHFDNDTSISIPLSLLKEYLNQEEIDELYERNMIIVTKDGREIVSLGITIFAGSYIDLDDWSFDLNCKVSVGVDGANVSINPLAIGFDYPTCHFTGEFGVDVFNFADWVEANAQICFDFNGYLHNYTIEGQFSIDLWLFDLLFNAGLTFDFENSPYIYGWLKMILNIFGWHIEDGAEIYIYNDHMIINGFYVWFGKETTELDSLQMEWIFYKEKERIDGYIKEPLVIPETGIVLNDSSYFYCNTTDSTLLLSSTYDGIDLNWKLSPDPFEVQIAQHDGFKFSISSDITLRLEILNDTSRYVEISKDGPRGQIGYNYGWELIDDYMTLTISWSSDLPPDEDFKLILKDVTEADILNLTNFQGNFQTSKAPASIWKYQDDLLQPEVYYELILNGLFNSIYGSNGDVFTVDWVQNFNNPIETFIFNYIRPYWNTEFDSLIVEVSTNEPSECWLYYGENTSSFQDTIQSSAGLSAEHQFKIYKDDIQSRWFYKIEASNEDGNTIYAGPLIVPPRGSPIADFSSSPLEGVKPLEVVFSDLSETGPSGAEIISWEWDFNNDGTIDSDDQNPTHTYTSPGHYTVSLKVTDTNSESDTKIVNNMIEVWDPPVANFSADPPLEGEPPLEIQFNDESTQGSGDIISWYWEFGDDSTSTDENPTHTYSEEDDYDVTLKITDSNSLEDSLIIDSFIFVRYKPIAQFSAVDTIGEKPLIVNFTDESYHPGIAEIDEWYWNFGDGTDITYTTFIEIITHTYPDSGHYTVSLKVTDTNNVSDTKIKNNFIEVWEPPVTDFSAAPVVGEPSLEVEFTDESVKGSGDIISWYWEFGDDSTSAEQDPIHTYTEEDHYDVTLTITDSNDLENSITKEDFIFVRYKPITKFSAVDTIGVKPLIVNFTDESYHPGIAEIIEWCWDFGDGTDITYTTFIEIITHTYPDSGHYTVSLKVTDTNDVSDTTIAHNMIEVWEPPVADFSYSPDSGPPPLTVHFEDNSQSGSGEIVFWIWKFGDGIEDPGQHQNPAHTYYDPGCYYITLIIRDSNGLEDSLISENCIRVYEYPRADFSAETLSGEPPLKVQFRDESIPGSGDINYWEWDFGDDQTSNVQDPTHIYEESGNYTISLIVKDTFNQVDDTTKINLIKVAKNCFYPNPYNPESGIVGTFRYTPKSSGNYTITIYDVSNQIVIELDCGSQDTNKIFEFNWNGKNASEKDVANGTYFYIIKSNTGDSYMNKLSILK